MALDPGPHTFPGRTENEEKKMRDHGTHRPSDAGREFSARWALVIRRWQTELAIRRDLRGDVRDGRSDAIGVTRR